MAKGQLNQVYATALDKDHPYGYALYEPVPSSVLKPGTFGYIAEDDLWTPLLDLSDTAAVQRAGFLPFSGVRRAPTDSRVWGPKLSSSVKQSDVDLKGSIS